MWYCSTQYRHRERSHSWNQDGYVHRCGTCSLCVLVRRNEVWYTSSKEISHSVAQLFSYLDSLRSSVRTTCKCRWAPNSNYCSSCRSDAKNATYRVERNWLQVGRLPHYQWKSHWTTTIPGKTMCFATLWQFKVLYMSSEYIYKSCKVLFILVFPPVFVQACSWKFYVFSRTYLKSSSKCWRRNTDEDWACFIKAKSRRNYRHK
jgi:hypothetical protein